MAPRGFHGPNTRTRLVNSTSFGFNHQSPITHSVNETNETYLHTNTSLHLVNETYFPTDDSFCSACPPGTYSAQSGSLNCSPCEPGTFAPRMNSSNCTTCPEGFSSFRSSDKLSDCNFCDAGFTSSSVSNCTMCEAGKYKNVSGNFDCTLCPVGSTSVPGSQKKTGCICSKGYVNSSENGLCAACEPGKFKNVTGVGQCTLSFCHPHFFARGQFDDGLPMQTWIYRFRR